MKWQKDIHFIEALYVVFLAFCLMVLSSCSHDPAMDKRIQKEVAAQPAIGPKARAEEGQKIIQEAPLSEKQKARLEEIGLQASTELKQMRDEEAKLRLLLIKQLVNPKASDREIDAIKRRILEANRNANKRWLSALDDARQVIGRKTEQDARYYRAFMEDNPIEPRESRISN